ncbi:MAG: isopeptide-forming domain-containing fimbrial protein [Coriobacteriales bacterium]
MFSGTLSGSGSGTDPYKLADIDWGGGVDPAELLINLKADSTIGSKFTDISSDTVSTQATAQKIAGIIENFNAEQAEAFAKAVKASTTGAGIALHYSNGSYTATAADGITNGYWAVIDETGESADDPNELANDQMQDVVLRVAGTVEVANAKITTVQSGKDTYEGTDSTNYTVDNTGWGNASDYGIGDKVPFRIWGTVPSDVAKYTDGYTWTLNDTLGTGLTFSDSVKVYIADLNTDGTPNFSSASEVADYSNLITVNSSSSPITFSGQNFNTTNAETVAGKAIVITYTATLNSNASAGTAVDNTVTLTHTTDKSNNGTTGTTPGDKTYTYTYKVINTKVDGNGDAITTADAEFKLVRQTPGATTYEVATITGGKVSGWTVLSSFDPSGTNDISDGTAMTADANGNFNVEGLDAGTTYYLVETKAPTGYNKLTAPVDFTIKATYTEDGSSVDTIDISSGTSTTIWAKDGDNTNKSNGTAAQKIANTPAGSLPSTGGMGTMLYIAVGLIIMAAAVALILVRRRNRANGQE